MKILITQPTFLPWIGYFDLIEKSDFVVFLDDVQFEKRSWQQRNKINTYQGLRWITLPVLNKGKREQLIRDVKIDLTSKNIEKIKKTIEHNYKKSKYFEHFATDLMRCFDENLRKGWLLGLNVALIEYFLKIFKIKRKFCYSSNLKISSNKSKKIVDICNHFNAKTYITTAGSNEYLKKDINIFYENKIYILTHSYDHPNYRQCFSPFSSHASIIDLLFNEGDKSFEILNVGKLFQLK